MRPVAVVWLTGNVPGRRSTFMPGASGGGPSTITTRENVSSFATGSAGSPDAKRSSVPYRVASTTRRARTVRRPDRVAATTPQGAPSGPRRTRSTAAPVRKPTPASTSSRSNVRFTLSGVGGAKELSGSARWNQMRETNWWCAEAAFSTLMDIFVKGASTSAANDTAFAPGW